MEVGWGLHLQIASAFGEEDLREWGNKKFLRY